MFVCLSRSSVPLYRHKKWPLIANNAYSQFSYVLLHGAAFGVGHCLTGGVEAGLAVAGDVLFAVVDVGIVVGVVGDAVVFVLVVVVVVAVVGFLVVSVVVVVVGSGVVFVVGSGVVVVVVVGSGVVVVVVAVSSGVVVVWTVAAEKECNN